MNDTIKANQLLKLARDDIDTIEEMLDRTRFMDKAVGFFAQQGVEKLLNATLAAQDTPFPLTHHLQFRWEKLSNTGFQLQQFEELKALTPFATVARYDTDFSPTEVLNREELLVLIEQLYHRVYEFINNKQSNPSGE